MMHAVAVSRTVSRRTQMMLGEFDDEPTVEIPRETMVEVVFGRQAFDLSDVSDGVPAHIEHDAPTEPVFA